MDMAEELYNSCQTSKGEMAINGMPKLLEQSGNLDGQTAIGKM